MAFGGKIAVKSKQPTHHWRFDATACGNSAVSKSTWGPVVLIRDPWLSVPCSRGV